jgi:hypothetical protein
MTEKHGSVVYLAVTGRVNEGNDITLDLTSEGRERKDSNLVKNCGNGAV